MNTNFAFEKPNNVDLLFLAAVCNSRPLSWVYEQYFGSLIMSGGYYQFQAPQLKTLPIPRIAFETQIAERRSLVNLAVSLYAKGFYEKVIAFSQEQLTTRPVHSDVVHDVLAYLAEQMLRLNKKYQSAREAFLTDIEGILSSGETEKIRNLWLSFSDTARLTNTKKPVKGIDLHQEQGVTLGLLSEDQWKMLLKKKLGKILNLSDLVSVYRKHHAVLAEITDRLMATDYLIDQIVYCLFGLNAEDIKAIEKPQPRI